MTTRHRIAGPARGVRLSSPSIALLALSLCAAAAFVTPCFAQAIQPAVPGKASPAPTGKPKKPKPAEKPAATQLLDINTASEQELRALKEVGDVRAANIIKSRPYKGKDELAQKNIIPLAFYPRIKDMIIGVSRRWFGLANARP